MIHPDANADEYMQYIGELEAEIERLHTQCGGNCRYWEGRWRDEAAENERLRERVASLQASAGYEASIAQVANERLRTDLAEIARLRLATDEGSLRVRADRMWEIASRRD